MISNIKIPYQDKHYEKLLDKKKHLKLIDEKLLERMKKYDNTMSKVKIGLNSFKTYYGTDKTDKTEYNPVKQSS